MILLIVSFLLECVLTVYLSTLTSSVARMPPALFFDLLELAVVRIAGLIIVLNTSNYRCWLEGEWLCSHLVPVGERVAALAK